MDIDKKINILKHEIVLINDKIKAMKKCANCDFEIQKLRDKKRELESKLDDLYPDIIA